MVDGVTHATIALNGSVVYEDINEVKPRNGFAASAVITLADGTTETIENTLIADTCACQVGAVSRAGTLKFTSIEVGKSSLNIQNGTQENPYVITAFPVTIDVTGAHDLYYTYTNTTGGLIKLEISYTAGCAVSFIGDNLEWDKDAGAMKYLLLVFEGQTVIINLGASVGGTYEITGGGKK
jgi:hypothetical protein